MESKQATIESQDQSYDAEHLLYSSSRIAGKTFMRNDISKKPTLKIELYEESLRKKTAAVLIVIANRDTFKHRFYSYAYSSQETELLYCKANGVAVDLLIDGFEGKFDNLVVKKLFKEISSISPDRTTFFWECSTGYSQSFPGGNDKVMKLLSYIVKGKHRAGFFAYSACALITHWNESVLGPKPLLKIPNEMANSTKLMYSTYNMNQVDNPSEAHEMNHEWNSIYSVNKQTQKFYRLEKPKPIRSESSNFTDQLKNYMRMQAHVLLTYPGGGQIMIILGNWIDLVKDKRPKDIELVSQPESKQKVQYLAYLHEYNKW